MRHAVGLLSALPAALAVLLAACGGASPAANSPVASITSSSAAAPVPAAAGAATKPSDAASPQTATGPAALALAWGEAINRGDVAGAAGLFAENAVFVSMAPCYLTSPCTGSAAIAKRAQAELDSGNKQMAIGAPIVAGNIVQLRKELRNPAITRAGLQRVIALTTVTVQRDKIVSWLNWQDLRDEQTLRYRTLQPANGAPAAVSNAPDPGSVASRWSEVLNSGDANAVADLFTDNAVFIGGAPCNIGSPCIGTPAIVQRVQTGAAQHQKQTATATPLVAGSLVQLRWEGRSDDRQAAGVERSVTDGQVVVQGNKIAAFASQQDLSDAQTLKFQLSPAKQAPGGQSSAKPAVPALTKPTS